MTKEIDWTKPIRTAGGFSARLAPIDVIGRPECKIVLVNEDGLDYPYLCYESGVLATIGPVNPRIENVPEEQTVWVNIYDGIYEHLSKVHLSRSDADETLLKRTACVKLTYTDGEGLE